MIHSNDVMKVAKVVTLSSTAAATAVFTAYSMSSESEKRQHPQRLVFTYNNGPNSNSIGNSNSNSNLHHVQQFQQPQLQQNPYNRYSIGAITVTQCSDQQYNDNSQQHEQDPKLASTSTSTSTYYKPISKTQSLLHKFRIYNHKNLHTPRLLSPNDPIFDYHLLKKGLKSRQADELKLRKLQIEIETLVKEEQQKRKQKQEQNNGSASASANNDERMEMMKNIMERISEIAYGKGITPQMREDFLIKYGCTAYSTPILNNIIQYSANHGIIEVGAGNGQWAKAISDHHTKLLLESKSNSSNSNSISIPPSPLQQFIVAYDDMSQLPLNTKIYHKYTQPSQTYFYQNVQSLKGEEAVSLLQNRGRVLLLVFPTPGSSMAVDIVKQYSKFDGNDVIIYVGEGKGGANANQEFFDFFLNGSNNGDENGDRKYKWILMETMEVEDVLGGGKGFEMMFVLKKVKI